MSNSIQSTALRPLQPYHRVTQAPAAQAPHAPATTPPPASSPPAASANAAQGPAKLTAAEQQTIDSYFPETPKMTLRLYGPGQQATTLTPGALGSRLDLRG